MTAITSTGIASSASTPYLDAVAATDAARSYKRELLAGLAIEPGHRVLDVSCGPGTDLIALAAAAGMTGAVLGIDQGPQMAATARARMADQPTVQVRQADAHHLPFAAHSIDRARADRVLMHVADPAAHSPATPGPRTPPRPSQQVSAVLTQH